MWHIKNLPVSMTLFIFKLLHDLCFSTYDYFWGRSFPAVSATGAHAAIIHYHPTIISDSLLDTKSVYLLDSGGQYL